MCTNSFYLLLSSKNIYENLNQKYRVFQKILHTYKYHVYLRFILTIVNRFDLLRKELSNYHLIFIQIIIDFKFMVIKVCTLFFGTPKKFLQIDHFQF